MWSMELFGTDVYHLIAEFVIYSILGWLLESIYMSFCNKKITNRGFAKSPFCPIYGFGATFGYIILCPLKNKYIWLFLAGAVVATIFEYIVGRAMIKLLGELWWDYNDKPFNFQGIICLESTIAWGFYALGVIQFLHDFIYRIIDKIDVNVGRIVICIILTIVIIDYIIQLMKVFKVDLKEKRKKIKERVKSFRARWN